MQSSDRGIPKVSTAAKKKHLLEKLKSVKIPMPAEKLLKQYAAGERDFRRVNLNEQILSEADLSRADLSEATLHRATLERTNLTRVNLTKADLVGQTYGGQS